MKGYSFVKIRHRT